MYKSMKAYKFLILILFGCLAFNGQVIAESFFEKFAKDFSNEIMKNTNKQDQTQKVASVPMPIGTVTKSANIRSGPGTSNPKVSLLSAGTTVGIISKSGNWYHVQVQSDDSKRKGWIYAPLVELGNGNITTAVNSSSSQAKSGTTPNKLNSVSIVSYVGYSNDFLPIKKMLEQGDLEGIEKLYKDKQSEAEKTAKKRQDILKTIGFLQWLESGTLGIDTGKFDDSVKNFTNAETVLDMRQQQSKLMSVTEGGGKWIAGILSGDEELQDYSGEGFERVLMLNYKSIAYLLSGKRKAYNVTRRAIDWQNLEKKAFEEKQRQVKQKLKEEESKKPSEEDNVTSLEGRVSQDYKKFDKKALSVPSAYVNPFGYYVAGMIQEYESYDDWSLRDNAKISYKKALKLNPKSKVLKKAAKEMEKRKAPGGTRLVHVVVANGFVPEKKLLIYNIGTPQGGIPIKLTLYEPDPTKVHRIEVQTTSGKRRAVLSEVADVEALVLRHQKDMEPFRQLNVMLSVISGQVIKGALDNLGFLGKILSQKREEMAAPDMRSWMSLPASIQAARLHLPKGVSRLKLVSYDKKGKRLASKVVNINKNSHDFVYARSLDNKIYAHAANGLWMISGK